MSTAALAVTARRSTLPTPLRLVRPGERRPSAATRDRWLIAPLVAVVGELIADKLPAAPSRLKRGPFAARLILGATTAAVAGRRAGKHPGVAASWSVKGLLGAAVGSVAGSSWRKIAHARFGSDLPGAVLEDYAALSLAAFAVLPLRAMPSLKRREVERASSAAPASTQPGGTARNPGIGRTRAK